jgi:hypothetical protein
MRQDEELTPIDGIKSRERVAAHGEVFTPDWLVQDMLDLVAEETERIESRFLEPACGDGNFLEVILRRKLNVACRRYAKKPALYEKYSVLAVACVYGVELLQDNAEICRERLFSLWDGAYQAVLGYEADEECRDAVRFILSRNILCGNALSMCCVDDQAQDTDEPIVFSEWSLVTGSLMQRRDFCLDQLLKDGAVSHSFESAIDELPLISVPKSPEKVFPLTEYRKVHLCHE